MRRSELKALKRQDKWLDSVRFSPLKKNSLPMPLKKIGGPRLSSSGLIEVADRLHLVFVWRDGDSMVRRAFFGYLFRQSTEGMTPLAIMHYHPSHKGVHMMFNCNSDIDYTDRQLPGARELSVNAPLPLDPANERDRGWLICEFCRRCNIALGNQDGLPL